VKMETKVIKIIIALVALASLYASAGTVEDIAAKNLEVEVLYLPSGEFLKEVALGYHNLAADIIWLRTIQYYGGYRLGENSLELFDHLVSVTTNLDPKFKFAYIFGALIIAEDLGCVDHGIEILNKGIRNNPDDWWLTFELGFLHYVYQRDYQKALKYFQQASRMPEAGSIARRFAAYVALKAGHRETSIRMWKELASSAENEDMKRLAERYIEKYSGGVEERRKQAR
jgi:tetratricopeptide (TPR) repeat protein